MGARPLLAIVPTLFFLVAAVLAPAVEPAKSPAQTEPVKTEDSAVVDGNTQFAFDLYARLGSSNEGNLFFSPHSISTALAMTYAGAKGPTAEEMAKVLHFGVGQDQLHPAFAEMLKRLTAESEGGPELAIANRLWVQADYKLLDEYLRVTREHYGAEVAAVDFVNNATKAAETINGWVEEQTRGKIKDLISPDALNSLTRLVLTNAIYFKGKWSSQFNKDATQNAPFTLGDGKTVEAPLMFQQGGFRYGETDELQLVELPYKGDELSMVVLLPERKDGLADLEKSLSPQNVKDWLAKSRRADTHVYLPRFKMTSEFSLADTLSAMGMPLAFSQGADFSGMNGQPQDLYVSAVVHKAFVDVNEEGTEAAAATGVVVVTRAAPSRPRIFRADHPFVFLIRDIRTGSVLFMGRVANPAD